MAFRCAVATWSFWPPDRNTMPGTAAGTLTAEAAERGGRDLRHRGLTRTVLAGDDHVRLEQHPFQRDPLLGQLTEHGAQDRARDFLAALDGVRAVHQHLGLDDRHEAGLLAERARSARARARSR